MKGIFITGTDTGIGKTYFTLACIRALQASNIKTTAMKPIASDAEMVDGKLRNDDAVLIQQALNYSVAYDLINPYVFALPVSPHIAAKQVGVEIDLQFIQKKYAQLADSAEFSIVEGIGGWLTPISARQTVADLASVINLPIILVVGIRLGCLNHAMLTVQSIAQSGLKLQGWVANCIDPNANFIQEQIHSIASFIGMAPCSTLAYQQDQPVCLDISQIYQ